MTTTPNRASVEPYVHRARRTNTTLAEEQKLCYQLRLQHYTIRQIAAETGLSIGTVHKRITDEITETVSPYREQYRVMERERLENMSREVLALLERKHYVFSEGRVARLDGVPVVDDEFALKCIDRLLRIQERRAKLEGLDAPVKVEAQVTEVSQVDIEAAEMIREAKARAAAQRERLEREA